MPSTTPAATATRHLRRGAAPLLITLLGACGPSPAPDAAETLYFSAIPDDNQTDLDLRYGKVASYLSAELGIPVVFKASTDYGASVQAFRNGDVHLAWFGGVTGVQAREVVPGAQALAQGVIDPQFVSYFIAHVDSGIEPGEDFPAGMEGKTFTFGNRSSTSGRLMPEYYIKKHTGRTPEEFFGRPSLFSGSHDQTALQVQAGTVQCGALNFKVYDSMVADGELDPEVCVKVWTTPPYPDYHWVAHPDLEQRFGADFLPRLRETLIGITDPEILEALQRPEGFVAASNEDFLPIRQTMLEVGLMRE